MSIFEYKPIRPLRTAVVWPVETEHIHAAIVAADTGLIDPVFFGPSPRIKRFPCCTCATPEKATRCATIACCTSRVWCTCATPEQAARCAAIACWTSGVQAIIKGSLHTDTLMRELLRRDNELRTDRRVSHAFVFEGAKLLIVTDAAINIQPDETVLCDIIRNAVDLTYRLGVKNPKVAVLSAVETPTDSIPSTRLAEKLRGLEYRDAIVDGPFGLDNAVCTNAARIKGIKSPVAGNADILVVPDLVSGNVLAKSMMYFSNMPYAGIALGLTVPVMLTSRADSVSVRLNSCILAAKFIDNS